MAFWFSWAGFALVLLLAWVVILAIDVLCDLASHLIDRRRR